MSMFLGDNDGWREFPGDERQHYCYKEYSLCNKYDKLGNSFHNNDPPLHCEKCEQLVGKLLALAESIKTKNIKIKDILKIIESKEEFDNSYDGLKEKMRTEEKVTAVLIGSGGKRRTIEDKPSIIKRIFNH